MGVYQVVDTSKRISDVPEWFKGARLNYAENLLKHPDQDKVALYAASKYLHFMHFMFNPHILYSLMNEAEKKLGDTQNSLECRTDAAPGCPRHLIRLTAASHSVSRDCCTK